MHGIIKGCQRFLFVYIWILNGAIHDPNSLGLNDRFGFTRDVRLQEFGIFLLQHIESRSSSFEFDWKIEPLKIKM